MLEYGHSILYVVELFIANELLLQLKRHENFKKIYMKCFDPMVSRIISLESKDYLLNDKFYLKDFSIWDENIRDWLASQEKLNLGEEHLYVIQYLREYFTNTKVHPVVRTMTSELKKQFGPDKGTVKYFHYLFPGGIHQACLIAGLPMMDSCC